MSVLRGRVTSGRGDFSYWMDQLAEHYQHKTGVRLYPGTLNLELDQAWRVPANPARLEAHEYGGRVAVNIVPCRVSGRRGFILRTDQNELQELHHPRTIVEVAAEVRLRDELNVSDGDLVEVEID